ncbi:hypothetical protein DRE_05991 [Drechslerella stenobrocha 248]|uniref:Cation efflux protein n=1 Tax=Drechslerella stenobrocha 248 TaxID=1043628 RepID=W7HQ33_9PEZI|nr:hypothetical protein DRE_05991 [Drechslerella stenobrocha 248]
MAFSRSARIITLLVIDTVFFFLEIIVGYSVHSLALVADSFHMLNDVFSLIVALYAIRLAKSKTNNSKYTYGWQRAEVLGALVNGVFLIALCLSIVLEAIQRFFDPPVISQPVLILSVGSAGLASNIIGLFLFHDHGHSHGEHAPSGHEAHKHTHGMEGHIHSDDEIDATDETGDIESVLPQTVVGIYPRRHSRSHSQSFRQTHPHSFGSSPRHRYFSTVNDIHVHPALNRQVITDAGRAGFRSSSPSENGDINVEEAILADESTERTPLVPGSSKHKTSHLHDRPHNHPHQHDHAEYLANPAKDQLAHVNHEHTKPKPKSGGHSHQNLNMRGVFLHVLGDALGNVGVIASALFIWQTDFWWRFYFDPAISLVITIIIFASALPLCKSAARILLQAVPNGISLDDVRKDIENVPGVLSVHELHIWQLSDIKMVASLHVRIAFNPHCTTESHKNTDDNPTARYIALAEAIRECLHAYGIHSSTIQPEYSPSGSGVSTPRIDPAPVGSSAYGSSNGKSKASDDEDAACLMGCSTECEVGQCCGPTDPSAEERAGGHGHAH